MPKRKRKYKTKLNQSIGKPNWHYILGNWRGIENHFFNKVRKGFERILGKTY